MFDKRFNLICGHYGCGKTNLALNVAKKKADEGEKVILVDLDLVNPYFRSSDYAAELGEGISVIAPVYANSNVDIPSLPASINSIFDTDAFVILDIGGDDVGATVLGRFTDRIKALDYDMYYVINKYRNLTATPEEAAEILSEIERVSRLKATAIINNSHLKAETVAKTVTDSMEFARETAVKTGLPIAVITAPAKVAGEVENAPETAGETVFPVDVIVKTGWE